ncbi:T9SS type A sorting domain-containing protein [Mangrovimonas aestuarii]|uniref:T9SS type A sorting domain-containing protein n=1 Tax=Mangrovimonas aestuarii TaxID=3018443 RepID=UPI0023785754|nr:T9SS type A sorting domain-containing protein [Mangrovimonas aestuarii]
MKKITCFLWAFLLSIVTGFAQSIDSQTFTATGLDSDSFTLTITPDQIIVNQEQTITSVVLQNIEMPYGSEPGGWDYCGSWYDFSLTVVGGTADGTSIANGCAADFNDLNVTDFTSIVFTSNSIDTYDDEVFLSVGLEVTYNTPSCPAPLNLMAESLSLTEAQITWSAGNAETAWTYEYGLEGFTLGEGISGTSTETTLSIDGLLEGVAYDIYVQANCGADDNSVWILESWTQPITGQVCEAAIEIASLPFNTEDDTSNYFNDYTGVPGEMTGCGTEYTFMNGDDVVYAYTPTEDTSLEVSVTPGDNNCGIFVFDDCANIGVSCVGGAADYSTDERNFDIVVSAGTTYYFLISTWGPYPESTTYDFSITENTCIDAVAEYSIVSDCDNEVFYVDVDITSMGSAISLTIEDDFGSTAQTVTATGVVQFGPYTDGAEVMFTVSDDNDTNCILESDVLTYACPISGQICELALEITELPYTTTDDTANYFDDYSGVPGTSCGAEWSYLNGDDVVYSYTATADMSIEVTMDPVQGFTGVFVYESCEDIGVSCIAGASDNWEGNTYGFDMDVVAGETYYIVISTWAAPQSSGYTLTLNENTCTDATVSFEVVSDCENSYGFFVTANIEDMGTATSLTLTDNQGNDPQTATSVGVLQFGPYTNNYNISINVSDDNDANCEFDSLSMTQDGCPPAYDNLCDALALELGAESYGVQYSNMYSTVEPNEPAGSCFYDGANATVWFSFVAPASGAVTISTDIEGASLQDTEIAVYETPVDCSDLSTLVEIGCDQDGGSYYDWNSVLSLTDLTPGDTYYIQVDKYGTMNPNGVFGIEVSDSETLSSEDFVQETGLSYYPNPVKSELTLKAQSDIQNIEVYNTLGQQVVAFTPNSMAVNLDMANLQQGPYFVKVTVNNVVETIRVVKQ